MGMCSGRKGQASASHCWHQESNLAGAIGIAYRCCWCGDMTQQRPADFGEHGPHLIENINRQFQGVISSFNQMGIESALGRCLRDNGIES